MPEMAEKQESDGSTDVATTEPAELAKPSQSISRKKRKRKGKSPILTQSTMRNPPWSYVHLRHITTTGKPTPELDEVTAQLHLTAAMTQFLGLHGAAVPIDILKSDEANIWIRVPADDHSALVAAVSGWMSSKGEGWQVLGSSSWDARGLGRDSGQDLFND